MYLFRRNKNFHNDDVCRNAYSIYSHNDHTLDIVQMFVHQDEQTRICMYGRLLHNEKELSIGTVIKMSLIDRLREQLENGSTYL